ncbi:MAG: DNA-directed RNA polymerase subunit H [Promethearchaeati archaeon SRVP18_Atabeyarchaeia-1]
MSVDETKKILDHEMVPRHQILTEEEKEALLKKYNIKAEWLPLIKSSDAAVRAIGGKAGNIIKIMRRSATAGEHAIFYRYVV